MGIALLLILGIFSSIRATTRLQEEGLEPGERLEVVTALGIFGIAPIAGSGWWLHHQVKTQRQQERDRLRRIFFELLQLNQGQMNVLHFAMQAGLTGSLAKDYLNQRAREFNATFDVSEQGGIIYQFNLDLPALRPDPAPQPTYDVVIQAIPSHRKRNVVRSLQKLTRLSWREVKAIANDPPTTVKTNVDLAEAEQYRDRLEAAGATVVVILGSKD